MLHSFGVMSSCMSKDAFCCLPKPARHGRQACIAAGSAAGVQCPIALAAAAHSP